MIDRTDILIIGGNIFSLYAGTILENKGINVTVIERDLFTSLSAMEPIIFHEFNDELMNILSEKSKSIVINKKNRNIKWPIDLYDNFRKNFKGNVLNYVTFKNFIVENGEVRAVRISTGTMNVVSVIVMDIGILGNVLNVWQDLKSAEYVNVFAKPLYKMNVNETNEKIVFSDGEIAYFSFPRNGNRIESIEKFFSNIKEKYPELVRSLIKRVWINSHFEFLNGHPRIGGTEFSNVYIMEGYSRFGVSIGLELSRLTAQLLLGEPMDLDASKILLQ